MADDRHLEWDGCANVRDLGGLPAGDGRETRRGAVVRADGVYCLTDTGWSALRAHGIRTVIDLRNHDELVVDVVPRPADLCTVHVPLDGIEDTEFWEPWINGPEFATPLYYAPFLERFPERTAAVVAAVAQSPPGGVLIHCVRGRDRTGLVAILLLALAGVSAEDIAADYALSGERLRDPELEEFLAGQSPSPEELIVSLLASLDVVAYLLDAGLTRRDLAAVRARLLGPQRQVGD